MTLINWIVFMNHREWAYFVTSYGVIQWKMIVDILKADGKETMFEAAAGILVLIQPIDFSKKINSYQLLELMKSLIKYLIFDFV